MSSPLHAKAAAAIAGASLGLGVGGPVLACTTCNSDTAAAVRAGLLGADFVSNAAAVLAPAPLLAAALLLVGVATRDGRGRRSGHG